MDNIPRISRKALVAAALISLVMTVFPTFAGTKRFHVVFVTPVKYNYSLEDVLQSVLESRISVDVTRLTWSTRQDDRADLIKRIRAEKPDLIYTWGTPTTKAIAGTYDVDDPLNILDVPVVFATVAWPDQTKIVRSFKRPGRNVTGATHVVPVAEQMSILLRWGALKHASIGTIYNVLEPNSVLAIEALKKWCDEHHVTLHAEAITPVWRPEADRTAITDAVARLATKKIDWLYLGPDTLVALTYAGALTDAALEARLPTFSAVEIPVRRNSALWGLYMPAEHEAIKVADTVVTILNNSASASDIPVVTMRQNIMINQDVMTALNFYPPTALRKIANMVKGVDGKKEAAK
jgi:putative ABC transport system substrate-binding protein